MLALSDAADRVAEGQYDVEVPHVPGGGEIGHLANRFREMTARLAEAEELERNFLMSVSHELRTPLTAIRGHVAALREGVVTEPEAAEESLAIVADEAERLGRLVNDVLDLAKLDAHRFTVLTEEVDMSRLCDRAYSTFCEEARRRGIDYTQDAEGAPVIVSDGDRVLQIISNLLSNAFRWTPDGGRIGLEVSSQNGTVTVDVADTGPGISPEERERIFRPFWSTDGRGTGLGLPIARELAVALGGRIELQTSAGQGSRFRLVLPLVAALAGVAQRVDRAADGGALDLLEPGVDALPAGRDEVDEQGEVVDPGVALGEQVPFESLEPADRLVQQAADLGEVARDREHLGAQPVLDGGADLLRQRSLELGRRLRERLDLRSRTLERRLELRPARPGRTPRRRFAPWPARVSARPRGGDYSPRRMDSERARLRPAARADRAASGRAARRVSAARLRPSDRRRPSPRVRRPGGGDRGCARRRQRHARRPGADPDRAAKGRGAAARALEGERRVARARPADAAAAGGRPVRRRRAARASRRGPLARAARRRARR